MPTPSYEELEQLLPRARSHEAISAIHGFEWQKWLTLQAWLNLGRDQSLWIEWAEDFTIIGADGSIRTIQAKTGARNCTLAQRPVLDIISRAFTRPAPAETLVWQISQVGTERGTPFGEPGILHWTAVASSKRDVEPLRTYLMQPGRLSAEARQVIGAATREMFRALLARVKWVHRAPSIEGLREEVAVQVLARLDAIGIKAPEMLVPSACAVLFDTVGATCVLPDAARRQLTSAALTELLINLNAALHSRAVVTAPGYGDPPFLHQARGTRATPLSAGWFVYTARTIPLLAREAELDQLRAFVETNDAFSWWAIGGPAGVGKSRLANDFLDALPGYWRKGFADSKRLDELAAHLGAAPGNVFVVLDYASMAPSLTGGFLVRAAAIAASDRKVRVLLLDRDVGDNAHWLSQMVQSLSSQSATIEASRYQDPMMLAPLQGNERQLITSWLEAAGLEPAKVMPARKAYVWSQIRRLTGSRPLHLGLIAAAFAEGRKRLDSPEDLLDGLLHREVARWKAKTGIQEEFASCIDALATATAAWGLPIPWSGTLQHWLVQVESAEDQARYFPEKFRGRPVSYAELLAEPTTREMAQVLIGEAVERVASVMWPGASLTAFTDLLWQLQDFTGDGWRVEPDALGEYFLAQYWQDRPETQRRRYLPPVSDAQLSGQLQSAWVFGPLAVVMTLSHLREHEWAKPQFVRAVLALVDIALAKGASRRENVAALASLLHDAVIRVGSEMLPHRWSDPLFKALERLYLAYPDFPPIAHAFFRRLKASLVYDETADYADVMARLLSMLPVVMRSGQRELHLHAMDVVIGYVSSHAETLEEPFSLFENTVSLVQHYGRSPELDTLTAKACFGFTALGHPSLETGANARRFRLLHTKIEKLLVSIVRGPGPFASEFAEAAVNALFNLTVTYRRESNTPRVEHLGRLMDHVWGGHPPNEIFWRARLGALFNVQRAALQRKLAAKARNALIEAKALLMGCSLPAPNVGLIEMHGFGISYALESHGARELTFYVESLFNFPFDVRRKEILEELAETAYDLESSVGLIDDDAFVLGAGKAIRSAMAQSSISKPLVDAWRKSPVSSYSRAALEQALHGLLRYSQIAGPSTSSEFKLGQLLAIHCYRFGATLPDKFHDLFPFQVERNDDIVVVTFPISPYPGIRSQLPFEFA